MRQVLKHLAESKPSVAVMDLLLSSWMRLVILLKPLDAFDAKVTVIVPAHNVDPYIEQTLLSLQAQKYKHLRVILVDDQSTDETFLRASRLLPKLDLLLIKGTQEGPGGARNRGLSLVSETDFVLFLDGDDVLAPGAISNMVRLAKKYDADMVNGQSMKFLGLAAFPRRDTRFLYRGKSKELHTLESKPGMIYDSAVCNKLISWKFWTQHSLSWPVGVYFEDLILAAEIFTRGAKTLLTSRIVFFWRVRVRNTNSITQTHQDLRTLRDRVSAARATSSLMKNALLEGRISSKTVEVFQQKLLLHDLPIYEKHHLSPTGEAKNLLDELAALAGASK
jgi:glycosyltransferase involved in cell wall biosynthesis